jgi:hypothetical protein
MANVSCAGAVAQDDESDVAICNTETFRAREVYAETFHAEARAILKPPEVLATMDSGRLAEFIQLTKRGHNFGHSRMG